jgi:hypothetical protein
MNAPVKYSSNPSFQYSAVAEFKFSSIKNQQVNYLSPRKQIAITPGAIDPSGHSP